MSAKGKNIYTKSKTKVCPNEKAEKEKQTASESGRLRRKTRFHLKKKSDHLYLVPLHNSGVVWPDRHHENKRPI